MPQWPQVFCCRRRNLRIDWNGLSSLAIDRRQNLAIPPYRVPSTEVRFTPPEVHHAPT
jgi:hypothetical protein